MLKRLFRKPLATCALGVCVLAATSCTHESTAPTPHSTSWQWGGIARAVSAALSADNHNYVFGANPDEAGSLAELASVYNPSMQKLGEGFVAPDRDQLVVFDSQFKRHDVRPVADLGLPTQSTSAGSANAETAVFVFNESGNSSAYASRIVIATEGATSVVTRDMRPVALRACDDKTAVWLERDEDDGSGLAIVRMGESGLLSEALIDGGPSGVVASEFFSALGCGEEISYIAFPDDAGGADVFAVDDDSAQHEGNLDSLPEPGLNRSSRYKEGSVSFVSDHGTVTEVDLENQVARESEPLIGADRRAVSVTIDGEQAHVVTQPRDGAESLRVHSFSFADPRVDAEGQRLAKLSELTRRGASEGSYVIPMSVFPFDG